MLNLRRGRLHRKARDHHSSAKIDRLRNNARTVARDKVADRHAKAIVAVHDANQWRPTRPAMSRLKLMHRCHQETWRGLNERLRNPNHCQTCRAKNVRGRLT